MSNMEVELRARRNPDFGEQRRRLPTAYWKSVANYAEACEVCRNWMDSHDLGAGNWAGGRIRLDGRVVARVSYNGRVWSGDRCVYDPLTEP